MEDNDSEKEERKSEDLQRGRVGGLRDDADVGERRAIKQLNGDSRAERNPSTTAWVSDAESTEILK